MNGSCEAYRKLIPREALADLSAEQQHDLARHLQECPACRLEKEQYENTVACLGCLEDEPVPRHFFVYPQERRLNPWRLFRHLTPAWQATAAVSLLACLALLTAAAGHLQVRVSGGVLYAGFGSLPPAAPVLSPPLDTAALEARIQRAVEERTQADDRRWVETLRAEINRSMTTLTQQQRTVLEAALTNLESRMGNQFANAVQAIKDDTALSQQRLYQVVSLERERDLNQLSQRMNQLALDGERKSSQTDVILETLLQVAELRLTNTGGLR